MIFGERPIAQTLGCILAHSLETNTGRLRKGQVLEANHLQQLAAANIAKVTVARLEPNDVEENEAARRLGAALIANTTGLRASQATTGRVNIISEGAGLAVLDVTRLDALNALNPMITLATVPPYHQSYKDGLIATVKIISYAVPETDLAQACELARGAMTMALPLGKTVSLIITQIQSGNDESKAIAATQARVSALDSNLLETARCPHQVTSLSQAIEHAKGEVILILTASATSDVMDVAPAALVQAGGEVKRFGMPVDPGNLLFLGQYSDKPVIGLPGCARSPALNGADKVLSRVLCGIDVNSIDIAGMGVGGLLKEIPTRPRPRRG